MFVFGRTVNRRDDPSGLRAARKARFPGGRGSDASQRNEQSYGPRKVLKRKVVEGRRGAFIAVDRADADREPVDFVKTSDSTKSAPPLEQPQEREATDQAKIPR